MNAYEALNKAADQIEARPENYDFQVSLVGPAPPSSLYTALMVNQSAACMLGFVGRATGFAWHDTASDVAHKILGVETETFYDQIIEAALGVPNNEDKPEGYRALCNPAIVPNAMRKVARERYRDIPPKIKEIFETTNEVA
jgi:hypothetical protein